MTEDTKLPDADLKRKLAEAYLAALEQGAGR